MILYSEAKKVNMMSQFKPYGLLIHNKMAIKIPMN